jgi:hypothetical protein
MILLGLLMVNKGQEQKTLIENKLSLLVLKLSLLVLIWCRRKTLMHPIIIKHNKQENNLM